MSRIVYVNGEYLPEEDARISVFDRGFLMADAVYEVTAVLGSHSLGRIAKVHPGSVVGELAFLDGMPRSAKVWAVTDSDLYRLDFPDYQRFAATHPRQTCDLLFAIGRVVALRLRHTRARPS